MKLDEEAINAAARVHDCWTGEGTIGALNAVRNTQEIVQAYLRAVEDAAKAATGASAIRNMGGGENG